MMNKTHFEKWIRFCIVCLTGFVTFVLIRYTYMYVLPFFLSAFVSNITFPIVQKIERKWKLPRTIATLFVLFSFISINLCLFFVSASLILTELNIIIETLPHHLHDIKTLLLSYYDEQLLPAYERLRYFAPFLVDLSNWNIKEYIEFIVHKMDMSTTNVLTFVMKIVSFAFTSLSSILTVVLVFFIATFLMIKDYETLVGYLYRFIPKRVIRKTVHVSDHGIKTSLAFLKAQCVIAALTSCIVFVGLLVFRIEHPFMIAIIVLLIDLIPYVGVGFLFIPWIVYCFFTKQYEMTIQLSIVYSIVVFMRQMIEPRIIAKQIGIHPLIALLVLFAGFQYFGLIGIVITPFILIVISTVYKANLFHYVWHYIQHGSFIR